MGKGNGGGIGKNREQTSNGGGEWRPHSEEPPLNHQQPGASSRWRLENADVQYGSGGPRGAWNCPFAPCRHARSTKYEVARKGAEVSRGAGAAIVARQLAEAEEAGPPPDIGPRVRQLRDLVVARMAHGELSVTNGGCVWRQVRTEQRVDARVEDVEDGAGVHRQRDRQREVEPPRQRACQAPPQACTA